MQTVKPRCRVHAANNPYSKGGFYYVVHGLDMQVGCADLDVALREWYNFVLLLQTSP